MDTVNGHTRLAGLKKETPPDDEHQAGHQFG